MCLGILLIQIFMLGKSFTNDIKKHSSFHFMNIGFFVSKTSLCGGFPLEIFAVEIYNLISVILT